MIWLSFFVLISYIFACKYWKHLCFWRRKCVTYSRPVPLFGNLWSVVFRKISYPHKIKDLYNEFPQNRYNGIFELSKAKLLIRDRELAEDIFTKNFEKFADRKPDVFLKTDGVLGRNLYFSNCEDWKRIRPCMDNCFKNLPNENMFATISLTMESLTNYLLEDISKKKQPINFEAVDFFRRITNDVIAAIVFDQKCNSLRDKNNEFFKMTQEILKIEGSTSFKMFICESLPIFKNIFNAIPLFTTKASKYFNDLIFSKNAEQNKFKLENSPFSHLLRNTNEITENLSQDDVLAQALSFFFIGFEPLVKTMSFLAYELATNIQMQKRLELEVDRMLYENSDDRVSFKTFSRICYFDAVVLETLRKWPSAVQIERTCTKDYILSVKRQSECAIRLEKGDIVLLPVYGFHHDKQQFPYPEKFDPDRFLNKDLDEILNTFNFFPFGIGPRRCLAMELSILIVKTVFFDIISKFEISVIQHTEIPLQLSKTTTHLYPQNGIYLGLKPRK